MEDVSADRRGGGVGHGLLTVGCRHRSQVRDYFRGWRAAGFAMQGVNGCKASPERVSSADEARHMHSILFCTQRIVNVTSETLFSFSTSAQL